MEIELDKIITNLVNILIGGGVIYIRKLLKDLNASFKKVRMLEDKNSCIEKRLEKLEEKSDGSS